MQKDEILEKAKKKNENDLDEMEMQIMLKANQFAVICWGLLTILIIGTYIIDVLG